VNVLCVVCCVLCVVCCVLCVVCCVLCVVCCVLCVRVGSIFHVFICVSFIRSQLTTCFVRTSRNIRGIRIFSLFPSPMEKKRALRLAVVNIIGSPYHVLVLILC